MCKEHDERGPCVIQEEEYKSILSTKFFNGFFLGMIYGMVLSGTILLRR